MRQLVLSKSGLNKVKAHGKELKAQDFEGSIKSLSPGEWCLIKTPESDYMGFINPLVEEQFTCFYLVDANPQQDPLAIIDDKIKIAYQKRSRIQGYLDGSRLFYGASDGLPGLIIDTFENANIIQINTAGIDRYRLEVKNVVEKLTGKNSYLLDNTQYRAKEFLPTFEKETLPEIKISENNLKYQLRSEVLQKVGFYYDHRENRQQLGSLLKRLNIKYQSGMDLFSYIGAWGVTALKAGCEKMVFVDQGEFSTEIQTSLTLNDLSGRGEFYRGDVFKFLDDRIKEKAFFDLILSDPPAFAKSLNQKKQALEGYAKLHRKIFKLAAPNSLCVFSSCTHYVSHDEFLKNIQEAAFKENRKIQLVYTGMQGWDHPVSSLSDRSNYIKSYFYFVE